MSTKDIIDTLAGIEPGSALDAIRARRLQARENAQKSYLALFEPIDASDFSLVERAAVGAFVTGLHGESPVASFYRDKLAATAGAAAATAPACFTVATRPRYLSTSRRGDPWHVHCNQRFACAATSPSRCSG